MFRNVLCPVDFSAAGARALETAIAWAERQKASLDLVHVFDPPVIPASEVAPLYVDLEASIVRDLQDRMRAMLAKVHERLPAATGTVRRGIPARDILAHANASHADLIVLGTNGHGLVARAMLGSVADRVLRASTIPVLLVPHEGRPVSALPKRIVTPTDFSLAARDAVRRAVALADELGAEVEVVHAYEVPRFVDRDPTLASSLRKTMGDEVAAEHPELAAHRFVHVRAHEGPAPATIVALTEELGADLVVMASTGRGLVSALLLGGVTDRVARTSHVPVLVLRASEVRS